MVNNQPTTISLRTAALIAGLPLFLPAAPYAEFYVFKKLIIYTDAAQTTQNLLEHPNLFLSGIVAIFFMYLMDIVLTWALYIFLRPVHAELSLLAALFRLVYTVLALVALFNYIYAYHLVTMQSIGETFNNGHVMQLVKARSLAMNGAYIIFGIYLILIGTLVYKASYIPNVLGVLLMLAGVAWIIISVKPFFFKAYDLSWLMVFGLGELFFGIWLLVRGTRVNESGCS